MLPGRQNASRQSKGTFRKAVGQSRGAEPISPGGEVLRIRPVGRLKVRTWPERAGQREAGKRLVGNRGVEGRQSRVEPARHLAFVAAGNYQPKRLALLVEIFFDSVQRRVSLAVARAQSVGGGIHFRQPGQE